MQDEFFTCRLSARQQRIHPRTNPYVMQYVISYGNNEPVLLESFSRDVKQVYNLKAYRARKNELRIKGKWLYHRLKGFGIGKSAEWFVCDQIFNGGKSIIKEWLKAFFDDEAYVELRKFRISVNSVNPNGLRQVQDLLRKMGIKETSFNGPYHYKKCTSYRLSILKEDVERFRVYVGFNHPKKVRDLEELLDLRALTF